MTFERKYPVDLAPGDLVDVSKDPAAMRELSYRHPHGQPEKNQFAHVETVRMAGTTTVRVVYSIRDHDENVQFCTDYGASRSGFRCRVEA